MQRVYQDNQIGFVKAGTEVARIRETMVDDLVEVALCGTFSSDIANDIFDELFALISVGKGIELNLAEVTHLAPTINRVFLEIEKKLETTGRIMRMIHVPDHIYKEFKNNGMYELFEMELKK